MAAYDIQKHFKGLRVDTGRRRGRDPFATGFEDDSEEETTKRRSRARDRAAAKAHPSDSRPAAVAALPPTTASTTSPLPAPAPAAPRPGDDVPTVAVSPPPPSTSDFADERDASRSSPRRLSHHREVSPADRKDASQTRGPHPSRHTVASPFAGTKYLEDSDSDEEAVSSRKGSAESDGSATGRFADALSPYESAIAPRRADTTQRRDKHKKSPSGVSWRAFSASRAEQRHTEIEALQASLRQRGKSISFGTHATTDDGKLIPLQPSPELSPIANGHGRSPRRNKSPPRRAEDTKPGDDELRDILGKAAYDPREHKADSVTGAAIPTEISPASHPQPMASSPTFASTLSRVPDDEPASPDTSAMTDSAESILSKLTVSPPTIPEGKMLDHTASLPAYDGVTASAAAAVTATSSPLSRESSMRASRINTSRPARIPGSGSRRSSRRSTSATASLSPAQAFLSSWSRDSALADQPAPEAKPDDEGQEIGLEGEKYVIGRLINQGGFGVIREAHSITDTGSRLVRAVKVVRKSIPGKDAAENDRAQQELEHEISVWRHLDHRHILRLHAVYDTDYAMFCLMDLNVGGTLFDVVRQRRLSLSGAGRGVRGLEPKLAKTYAYQLASALRYLHQDVRVCHRDVKLENCLIDMTGPHADTDGGNLRLCDFGLADFLHSNSALDEVSPERLDEPPGTEYGNPTTSSVIGTLEYASPRGLSANRKLFETAGDVWAYGVIVYTLCTGDLPFRHTLPAKIVERIMSADWDENALKRAAAGSHDVIDLVKGCLEKDIDLRFTIGDALRSSWFDESRDAMEEEITTSPW